MPSSSATRQACCPPAPPKQASVYSVTSWPRCTEINLIAFAMCATAMRMKPSATASGHCAWPIAADNTLRRVHDHAACPVQDLAPALARLVPPVGGGAARVDAVPLWNSRRLRGAHHADDAACGPGKDRVLALEAVGVG